MVSGDPSAFLGILLTTKCHFYSRMSCLTDHSQAPSFLLVRFSSECLPDFALTCRTLYVVGYPEGFQGNSIPIDGKKVAELVHYRLSLQEEADD